MALRSPSNTHSFWGFYPNFAALPVTANTEVGDTAFNQADELLYVYTTLGWVPVGGGGGGVSLAATLVIGNTTSGTDIEVSTGDTIIGQTNLALTANAGDVALTATGVGSDVTLTPDATGFVVINGSTGINVAAPTQALDVLGNIQVTAAGGQSIYTDASGGMTFLDPAGPFSVAVSSSAGANITAVGGSLAIDSDGAVNIGSSTATNVTIGGAGTVVTVDGAFDLNNVITAFNVFNANSTSNFYGDSQWVGTVVGETALYQVASNTMTFGDTVGGYSVSIGATGGSSFLNVTNTGAGQTLAITPSGILSSGVTLDLDSTSIVNVGSVNATGVTLGSGTAPVTFAGAFTFPVVDGAAGEVLTTDGAGNVTWQPGGGGGGASLAATLLIGNTTGPMSIVVSSGSEVQGESAAGVGGDLILHAGSATSGVAAGGDVILRPGAGSVSPDGFVILSDAAAVNTVNLVVTGAETVSVGTTLPMTFDGVTGTLTSPNIAYTPTTAGDWTAVTPPAPSGTGTAPTTMAGALDQLAEQNFYRWLNLRTVEARTVSGNAIVADDSVSVLLADASGGAIVITLPNPLTWTDKWLTIKKTDATANVVTVTGGVGVLIDGAGTQSIAYQYDAITVVSDGTNWAILDKIDSTPPTPVVSATVSVSLNGSATNGAPTFVGGFYVPAVSTYTVNSRMYLGINAAGTIQVDVKDLVNTTIATFTYVAGTSGFFDVTLAAPVAFSAGWYNLTLTAVSAGTTVFARGMHLTTV